MPGQSKTLTTILVVLVAAVLLTSAAVVYLVITRQPAADSGALEEAGLPAGAAGTLALSAGDEPRIAYVTFIEDEECELSTLHVSDTDGSNPHLVAETDSGRCLFPSWSPDGRHLAYLMRTPGEDGQLWDPNDLVEVWVAPLDGSEQIRVSDILPNIHEAFAASWSADGTRFAFLGEVEGDTTDTLFIVRADGTEVEYRIPLDFWAIEQMLWSPGGDEFLFIPETDSSRMTAHLLSLEDMQITPILDAGMLDSWGWGAPLDWAPSGEEFAVADPLAQEILVLNTDGELRQIFRTPGGFPVELAWSPSGTYIAVSVSTELLDAGDTSDMTLCLLDVEVGELTPIFHQEEMMVTLPNWSADGNLLAFTALVVSPEGWWSPDSLWLYDTTSDALEQAATGWGTVR
jgi:Tol biopolymer transport system component